MSDLHFEKGYHHKVYEYPAFEWLIKVITRHRPSAMIGLGDWGTAWTPKSWAILSNTVAVNAIYGNHEKIQALRTARNGSGGLPVLAEDGEVRMIQGVRFGFINGIIATSGQTKRMVPRKTPDEFRTIGRHLVGVDVLCTHPSPLTPEYGTGVRPDDSTVAVRDTIEYLQPPLAISGHLSGPFTVSRIGKTLCVRIDSSQQEKHFAIIEPTERRIEVWYDHFLVADATFGAKNAGVL